MASSLKKSILRALGWATPVTHCLVPLLFRATRRKPRLAPFVAAILLLLGLGASAWQLNLNRWGTQWHAEIWDKNHGRSLSYSVYPYEIANSGLFTATYENDFKILFGHKIKIDEDYDYKKIQVQVLFLGKKIAYITFDIEIFIKADRVFNMSWGCFFRKNRKFTFNISEYKTSGNTFSPEIFFYSEWDGKTFKPMIDPNTGQPIGNSQGKDFREYCGEEEVAAVFRLLEGFDPGWALPNATGWTRAGTAWPRMVHPPRDWKRIVQKHAGPLDDLMLKLRASLPAEVRAEFADLRIGDDSGSP